MDAVTGAVRKGGRMTDSKRSSENTDCKSPMDVVTFVEEHLGIELLPYQKKYLKCLLNQDTKHTYWITYPPDDYSEECIRKAPTVIEQEGE